MGFIVESELDLDPGFDFSWIQSPDQGIFQSFLIFPLLKVKNLVRVPNWNQGQGFLKFSFSSLK